MDIGELVSYAESACMDMGADIGEAEDYFEDADVMAGLIGDRIYGDPNWDELICGLIDEGGIFIQVAEKLMDRL